MNNPLVTVIIPLYNASQYIEQCIQSVREQTYTNLEIVVVNDGSTDNSREIAEEKAYEDSRIVIINQKNGGVSMARNAGIAVSHGDYICFVDSDDYLDVNCINGLMQHTDQQQMVVCNYYEVIDNSFFEQIIIDTSKPGESKSDLLKIFQNNCYWSPWGKLYHASLIKNNGIRFKKNCSLGEDLLFNVQVIINNPSFKVFYLNESLYYYRINPAGLSKQIGQNDYENILLQEAVLKMLNEAGLGEQCYNILHNAVLAFYSKYNRLTKESQISWNNNKLCADLIVKNHKKYLLKTKGKSLSEWMKMFLIVYFPGLFSLLYRISKR